MEKLTVDGKQYVNVGELRWEIENLRREISVRYQSFDKDHQAMVHLAYNDIIRILFRHELERATTPDEIREVLRRKE